MTMEERPYMPSSGTEGADFIGKWCANCPRDAGGEDGDGCLLLANSFIGVQPAEWRYWRGDPVCTAYEGEQLPYLRGCATGDLFPGAHRRPSTGEQIRMLVGAAILTQGG